MSVIKFGFGVVKTTFKKFFYLRNKPKILDHGMLKLFKNLFKINLNIKIAVTPKSPELPTDALPHLNVCVNGISFLSHVTFTVVLDTCIIAGKI